LETFVRTIGIDLGISKLALAWVNERGQPEIIRNERGRTITPSLLFWDEEVPVIGEPAREHLQAGRGGIVQSWKHLIGHTDFLWRSAGKKYTSLDLSVLFLSYLKRQAEAYFKAAADALVAAVPIFFTERQCQELVEAGRLAGFESVRLVSEAAAVALTYRFVVRPRRQRILIYDLGAGSFSVSLAEVGAGHLRLLASDGEAWLGGSDWHERLFTHVLKCLEQDGIELSEQESLRLNLDLVWTRHALSQLSQVRLSKSFQDVSWSLTLARPDFVTLTEDLLEMTGVLTRRLLKATNFSWDDIDELVLVGGATRMPMVRDFLRLLGGRPLSTDLNPDEAIACGAALYGADMQNVAGLNAQMTYGKGERSTIFSLGMVVERADGSGYANAILLPQATPLPTTRTHAYTLQVGPEGEIQLEVFLTRGESHDPCVCSYLSRFLFVGHSPLAGQMITLDLTCTLHAGGMLQILVRERSSGQPLTLVDGARPVIVPARFAGSPLAPARQKAQTIYFAVDLSGSMLDPHPLLEEAKSALLAWIDQCDLIRHKVGLIAFSDYTKQSLLATHDRDELRRAVEQLEVGQTGPGNNGHPFEELLRVLNGVAGARSVVLLTDGAWARPAAAREAARRCEMAGIRIFIYRLNSCADGPYRHFLEDLASSQRQPFITSITTLFQAARTLPRELGKVET
jgi:molecular chaperone DnaK